MKATSMDRRSLVIRGALVLCGLVVLSLVGRFAVAGGQVSPASVGGSAEPISSSAAPPPLVVATAIVVDASPRTPIAHAPHATEDDPVYLNDATVDDLRRLPGIGEKRALAVLELRKKLGRFKQVEDLLRVKGIGRSTLRKLRPLVRIDHPVAEGGSP
jgi:competence protein ComEA